MAELDVHVAQVEADIAVLKALLADDEGSDGGPSPASQP